MKLSGVIIIAAAVFLNTPYVSAQEGETPMEIKTSATNTPVLKSLTFSAYLKNSFYFFANGDLKLTDSSSYATVEYSDDAVFVGFSEIGVSAKAEILDYIALEVEVSRPGYWGNDSLTTGSKYSAFYLWTLLSRFDIAKAILNSSAVGLDLTIGRQPVSIIDSDDHNGYVLDDYLDAFRVDFLMKDSGIGASVFFDFFSLNSPASDIYTLKTPRHDYTVPYFDGDVNIFKMGIMPYWKMTGGADDFIKTLLASPYFLFARVGATGESTYNMGGYERSKIGTEGNFADNDWVMIAGLNVLFDTKAVSVLLEGAYSFGIDRKSTDKPNVDISGILLHGSVIVPFKEMGMEWFKFAADVVYTSGASTDKYGNYLNYGFVSMKGDKIGGYIYSKYYGVYPSAYINYSGIDFNPIVAKHKAPIFSASAKLEIENLDLSGKAPGKQGLNASVEGWFYMDTSSTSMDTNMALPPDVFDQMRLGRLMGFEIDWSVSYVFSQGVFKIGLEGGIFLPGAFYAYYASIKDAPYGNQPAFGCDLFTELEF
jgi:hypothetical protein